MKKTKLTVELSKNHSANLIKLDGEILESSDGEELYKQINRAIERKVDFIIIDLSQLKYIGNGGMKVLEDCQKLANKHEIELFIHRPR